MVLHLITGNPRDCGCPLEQGRREVADPDHADASPIDLLRHRGEARLELKGGVRPVDEPQVDVLGPQPPQTPVEAPADAGRGEAVPARPWS